MATKASQNHRWWVTAAAVGYTMVEQYLPTALKAVALVQLAGGAVAAAYLAWAAMRDDTRRAMTGEPWQSRAHPPTACARVAR